ncbi:Fe(2+) transporter permease subunit FeoB [Sansalvadorimonas verongulae]|uniref:Fe(2+) transporter permease subunit FeoB n=1 Tax=Sansalvadorimonas verongulae TaxID=2172824 RepID=UPI0012BC7281|nr:Fe(2+) transporter permease subunit FeoB [Sansalvadorimonas verongulae]MTI13951.1 Fe(2+) transporter permease subunit FeoB [Sansalvadorimonas verongulae]
MVQATVAVLGNPNCGKTTLFNSLTGAKQQVGNWPGVTVEKKTGSYAYQGRNIELVDLPGTYSLDVGIGNTSIDEKVARDYALANEADLYINIVDASNIERNLYLTTQLLEMDRPMMVVLNMMDVAEEKGVKIDAEELAKRLGCDVVPVVASRSEGTEPLKQAIEIYLQGKKDERVSVRYTPAIEKALSELNSTVSATAKQLQVNEKWLAGRLLEGDQTLESQMSVSAMAEVVAARNELQAAEDEEVDILFADARYKFIDTLTCDSVSRSQSISKSMTAKIDSVVLSRAFGLPIFFGIMYLMFLFAINAGNAFIDFFDILFGTIFVDGTRYVLEGMGAPEFLITLLSNGIGGGIQTVSTFIPVIAGLYLFLSILEDSGYMARAAFVMDRAMRVLGLPGKAFVPVLVGFGCNVPSIMATRTLEQERDRKLAILMSPFMSCGARLPVYALFAVVFFPETGQNVVFALYLTGIAVAVLTGLIMKNTLLPGEATPFVMELPRYHLPTLKGMLLRTWDRLKSFIIRAGKTIVIVVAVLGVLNSLGTDGSWGNENTDKSVLSRVGQSITPVFAPMGMKQDNWPAAVGLFTGLFAKESVIGTLDSLYSSTGEETGEFNFMAGVHDALASIPDNLAAMKDTLTDPLKMNVGTTDDESVAADEQGVNEMTYGSMLTAFGNAHSAFAYLLMVLLYAPCVAAMGAVNREAGRGYMWLVGAWATYAGYTVASLYYQVATFSKHPGSSASWIAAFIVLFLAVLAVLRRFGWRGTHANMTGVIGAK